VRAQNTEEDIKMAVNNMFKAMREADTAFFKTCFSGSVVLQTIAQDKTGNISVMNQEIENFLTILSQHSVGDLDERIDFGAIHIDGVLASVWTPYKFYYKGNFSHCGVNSFQLVHGIDGWKIQYIIDTRRMGNCD
jgi:predicted YcjX-like family ATPase